jgi:uncharacterized protein YjbI with pentapeptide repeats
LRARDFTGADLSNQDGDNLNFEGAKLDRANLLCVRFSGCTLARAHLDGADFSQATLRDCNFEHVSARGAQFIEARLENSTAEGADLANAHFCGSKLTDALFIRAILHATVFDTAQGDGIVFRGADLRGASLRKVQFLGPDFRGADLSGADLSGAMLKGADFRGALLEGTKFDEANLSGATFDAGQGPRSAATTNGPPPEPEDAAALNILEEFLSALPAAIAGAQPAEMMKRVQGLIESLAASWGYSPEQRAALRDQLTSYNHAAGFDPASLQEMIAALNSDSNEPPEELKRWLEPLMKNFERDRKA